MNYNIKGTGLEITPELRDYVEKRLAHANKFTNGAPDVHLDVELEYKEFGRSKKYRAEFTLSLGKDLYRANDWGETMHEAIDISIAALAHELRQTKKKRLHAFRHRAMQVKEYLRGFRKKI
ncbi:ribosome-associated translation inhibitor RaiA [Acetobacteraceae bacterium]|nr:ribosome-associated translation inhibitor RaiA [Candidatus Parcubacteria bacterium]